MDISQFLNFKDRKQFIKDVLFWLISGLLLLSVVNLIIYTFKFPGKIYFPESISVPAFFLLLLLLFMYIKSFFHWVKLYWWVFWNRNKVYLFNQEDWTKKWISNGRANPTEEGYIFVKSSRAGCLLKDYYWKNFKMSFEVKLCSNQINQQKRFGLIFRAEDLDNYFSIEIINYKEFFDEKNKDKVHPFICIEPLVKYKGVWEIMSAEKTQETYEFSETGFVKVSLEVKGDNVRFFYKETPIFKWILPIYVDVNHAESGVVSEEEKKRNITLGGSFNGHVQKIPFRLGYGLIGLRAHYHHIGTLVRNLRIEPL